MSNPLDATAIGELAEECGAIGLMVASAPSIRRSLDRTYDALTSAQAAIGTFGLMDDSGDFEVGSSQAVVDEGSPIVQVVRQIITQGVRKRASGVHIEALEDAGPGAPPHRRCVDRGHPPCRPDSITHASRIKVLADLNLVERRRPQDGQFSTEVDGRPIDIRTSVVNTIHGEKVVLRLLDKTQSIIGLENLGMPADVVQRYLSVVDVPVGMFLCTGPTGSGKTTSLYATLTEIQDDTRNVVTIEDPVVRVAGINQMQVHEAGGFVCRWPARHPAPGPRRHSRRRDPRCRDRPHRHAGCTYRSPGVVVTARGRRGLCLAPICGHGHGALPGGLGGQRHHGPAIAAAYLRGGEAATPNPAQAHMVARVLKTSVGNWM